MSRDNLIHRLTTLADEIEPEFPLTASTLYEVAASVTAGFEQELNRVVVPTVEQILKALVASLEN